MEIKVKRKESGQALVIILLVMAVGLTVALSIVSRSVTDIRISKEQEESARAFSAAEAGIEEALRQNLAIGSTISETIGVTDFTVSAIGQGGEAEFVFEEAIDEGDTKTVWLVNHVNGDLGTNFYSGTITAYWGNEGQAADQDGTPALEASIIYDSGGYKVARYTFDPNSSRTTTNKFDNAQIGSFTVDSQSFPFKAEITPLPAGSFYALRLKLLYNSSFQALAVSGSAAFPTQGKCYESTATVVESGITRKVRQCQSYPVPPAIFDYVLFSGGDLTK